MVGLLSRSLVLSTLILVSSITNAAQENALKLVANLSEPTSKLTRQQVRELYLGGAQALDMTPLNYAPGSRLRVVFNTRVIGLTESRIQSFWAQMKFTGRGEPPKEFDDSAALMDYLQRTPGTVAYVPADTRLPDNLTVLYAFE